MDIHEIDALKKMTGGEFRVWMAGKFETIEIRFIRLERKRWPWALAGGIVSAVAAGALTAVRLFT